MRRNEYEYKYGLGNEFNAETLHEIFWNVMYEATKNNDAQNLYEFAEAIESLNNIKEVIWSSDDDEEVLTSIKREFFADLADEDEA